MAAALRMAAAACQWKSSPSLTSQPISVDFFNFGSTYEHNKTPIQLPFLRTSNLQTPMTPPPKAAAGERRESPSVVDDSLKIHRNINKRKPVVIYMVSPEVIHVKASEFMTLVQRLTGSSAGGGKDSSPSVNSQLVVPVKVKARALNPRPPKPARDSSSSQLSVASAGETLFFHDLSPPSTYAARKDEPMAAPQSWLLRREYLDESPRREPGFGNGSAYLEALDRRPERLGGR